MTDWTTDEAMDPDYDESHFPDECFFDDDSCPFCGTEMTGRHFAKNCDDIEIYCPECGYIEGIQ